MKPIRILAQVRNIRANIGRDGDLTGRCLVLDPLDLKAKRSDGPMVGYAVPAGYGPPMGYAAPDTIAITMSDADSRTIKAGDWLAVHFAQLSEADSDQIAKTLAERADLIIKAEQASRTHDELMQKSLKAQIEFMERNMPEPKFDD